MQEEEKKKMSGHGNGGSGSGERQCERSKFGNQTGNQKPSESGVEKFNNVWHMYRGKVCMWNCTHTLAFILHSLSIRCLSPLLFQLLIIIIRRLQKEQHQGLSPPPSPSVPSVGPPSIDHSSNGLISVDKGKLLAVCKHHKHALAHPIVAAFFSYLKKMLN